MYFEGVLYQKDGAFWAHIPLGKWRMYGADRQEAVRELVNGLERLVQVQTGVMDFRASIESVSDESFVIRTDRPSAVFSVIISKERECSAQELVEKIGYRSKTTIARIESGEQIPDVDLLDKILTALHIEPKVSSAKPQTA